MSSDLMKKLGGYMATPLSQVFAMKNETERYSVEDLRQDWMNKVKNDPYLGWNHSDSEVKEETHRIFSKKPTAYHFTLIRQQWKNWKATSLSELHSVEAGGMTAKKDMGWDGTALTVGKDVFQSAPIVHEHSHSMLPSDEAATAVTAMLVRDNKGSIEGVLNPSIVDGGPLGTIMTSESYVNFVHSASQIVKDVGAQGKGDQFHRTMYRGMSGAPKEIKAALRHLVYMLFSPQKIVVNAMSKTITWDEANASFTVEKGVEVLKIPQENGKVKVVQVPRLVPGKLKGTAITVDKNKKDRFPPAQLADYITSHFPPALVKHFGFRMACDKTQRQFMAIRPFLESAVVVSPTPGMRRWIETNGLEPCIKTRPTKFIEGTLEDDDLELVFHNYEKGQKTQTRERQDENGDIVKVPEEVLFYGKVNLDRDFFTNFKILCYQPSPQGYWVYCPAQQDVKNLPAEAYGMKLTVVQSQIQMLTLLSNLIRSLATAVFQGHYMPNGRMYDDLKYPREQKEYEVVNLDGDDYVREVATRPKEQTYQQVTVSYTDDSDVAQQQDAETGEEDVVVTKRKVRTAKLPKLEVPTHEQWNDNVEYHSENVGQFPNMDPISDYSESMYFLPTGVGAEIKGDYVAWNYSGVEYVGVFTTTGGTIVTARNVWDEIVLKCMAAGA